MFSGKILLSLKQPLGPYKDNMTNRNHESNADNFTTYQVLFDGKQDPFRKKTDCFIN